MSSVVHKPKLLIVDTDTAMAQVLKTYAEQNNYDCDVFSDPADACAALAGHKAHSGIMQNYDCMVLGWPKGQVRILSDLLIALAKPDHSELPLIILSETHDPDLKTLVRRRTRTRTLLWRDYTRIEKLLASIAVKEPTPGVAQGTAKDAITTQPAVKTATRKTTSILLVDDTPAVCHLLRDMLENNGYFVALASTTAEARELIANGHFDLVLTEFFLPQESGEDLCLYLQSISLEERPVYAVMARKNLEDIVQRSLAVGAIACLDKSESTEILYARLNAIATGLSSRAAMLAPGVQQQAEHKADTTSVAALLQTVKMPALLVDAHRKILAANDAAVTLLGNGTSAELKNTDFEKTVHGAPLRRSIDTPVKALFKTLSGKTLSVAYRCREIDVSEYGIMDSVSMLTFESVEKKSAVDKSESDKPVTDAAAGSSSNAAINPASAPEAITALAFEGLPGVEVATDLTVAASSVKQPEFVQAIESPAEEPKVEPVIAQIQKALNADDSSSVYSLLTLDIKMVASVTGDRLSLGRSKPMVDMVETELSRHCERGALEYIGDGKFLVLYKAKAARQSYLKAEKLVSRIPKLIWQLADVQLLSHASLIELPQLTDFTVDYILKHCAAACLKTEVDGLDNTIYQIDAPAKLGSSKRVIGKRRLRGAPVSEELPAVESQRLESQHDLQTA